MKHNLISIVIIEFVHLLTLFLFSYLNYLLCNYWIDFSYYLDVQVDQYALANEWYNEEKYPVGDSTYYWECEFENVHMGHIMITWWGYFFFFFRLCRIRDMLGFYSWCNFLLFEYYTLYILSVLALIHFLIFHITIFQTGLFFYCWPKIYSYYDLATEPYDNIKEWERMNWSWLLYFMYYLCERVSVLLSPFIIYFCIYYLIYCNSLPIL